MAYQTITDDPTRVAAGTYVLRARAAARMRTTIAALVVIAGALLTVAPTPASALTANDVRIGAHPAYVRVVVDVGGGNFTREFKTVDSSPMDGAARVDVIGRGVTARSITRRAHGVTATLSTGRDRVVLRLSGARGVFKYVRRSTMRGPNRLVVDLFRSRPPVAGAEIRTDSRQAHFGRGPCLALRQVTPHGRGFRVRGDVGAMNETVNRLRVRDAAGRVVGAASIGFPDTRVTYSVSRRQAGTVEMVVSDAAHDGTLHCIVQTRVTLRP